MHFMRLLFIAILINLGLCTTSNAQITINYNTVKREVTYQTIGKDSVNIALNHEFNLIEDNCGQIIRRGHLNGDNKFYGKIKDVSKQDPSIILTEGFYTTDGLKDGYFITHYLNGNLQAKGNFKNNQYDGNWEIYYDDGKPMVTFTATGKDIKIIDAWDEKGLKTVDNSMGNYIVNMDDIYWKGKLLNGKADGTWRAYNIKGNAIIVETYKDGAFKKGSGAIGDYQDQPKLVLVPANKLPFTNAEGLPIAAGCDAAK